MSTTIESLELEIKQDSSSAVNGIEALSKTLGDLKIATKGGLGLTSVATQISRIGTALDGIDSSKTDKIKTLAESLEKLKNAGQFKLSSSVANQIVNIGYAADCLKGVDLTSVSTLATSLSSLGNMGDFSGLKTAITQLGKLPALEQTLNGIDWNTFTAQIQQLSSALSPLASQLNTISSAFSTLPKRIKSVVSATDSLTASNNRARTSYINLWAKARMAYNVIGRAASAVASWINESNQYIEDLNLFTVSMGEYAEEAQAYAEKVGDIMGIDPADWMRNQGVFNTIIKGFGVSADKAALMSQNLTQLGYDISSFYNLSVEDSMAKLQSGIAGELEPLRRIGYDLSVARLQQEAYNLGIKKSVSEMTQAEKSQLRYYAIMTQITDVQGDMARTLNAPANQLRVLKAQVTQLARALGNIFIPVLNAVLPYLIAFVKLLREGANAIAKFVGFTLPTVDYSSLDSTSDAVSGISDSADDAKSSVDKLKRSVMGFDELNLLSDNSDSSSDALSNLGGGDLGIDLPEYDFLNGLVESRVESILKTLKDALWEVTAVISGFLLAIGTILVVTGVNIPVGLALMAAGATGLASAVIVNWNNMSQRLAGVLNIVTSVIAGFLLAIGALLVFTGANVPLGVGLMVAGAVALATAVTINWKFMDNKIQGALSSIEAIIGGALMAMGAVLAFSGVNVPLGIAFMAAGATGVIAAVTTNWNSLPNSVQKVLSIITGIVAGALLAIGAILALSGDLAIGIPLLALGAFSLVSAVAVNWGSIANDITSVLSLITSIASGALIALGIFMICNPYSTPLGIGLIAAGAVGLAASMPLDWGSIVSAITSVLQEIGIVLGAALLAIGAILTLSGASLPFGIALLAAGAVSLVTGVALNWGSITSMIKQVLEKIGILVGAALLALGVILTLSGVGLPIGIALIAAGAASLTAGVALNWNTIVGKVKSALSTIARLFTGVALVALGIILCGTVVGLPLGIGLIAAGASAITKPESFNVQSLVNIGKQAIEGVKTGVQNAWTKFKTYWEGIFSNAVSWVKKFLGINSPSTVFQSIGSNMVSGLKNGLSKIGSTFSSVFTSLKGFVSQFGSKMYSWGSDLMKNMVSGINGGLTSLKNKVSQAASTIRSYLHFTQPDVGPLSDFNTWMPDMMSQLAQGIAKDEYKVQREMEKLAGDMDINPSIQANVSAYGATARSTTTDGDSSLVSAIYNAVASAMSGGDNDESGTPIIINLGNEQIASFLVKQNKRVALISGGKA